MTETSMHAAVLRETTTTRPYSGHGGLRIESVPVPTPRAGELRVRIAYAGLCHSDLSVLNGVRQRPLPMVLGHEAVGVVDAVGDGVTDVGPGEHVVLVFVPSCRQCRECRGGRPNLCSRAARSNAAGELLSGGTALTDGTGHELRHQLGVSAFADYAVVARESAVVIDPRVPLHVAALFGCAVLTGVGAVLNTAQATAGQSVAVFGLGGVGLSALLGAVVAGADPIIAVDPVPEKRKLALELGATDVVAPEEAAELVRRRTAGGVDVAVEAVGSGRAIAASVAVLAPGGAAVCVGLPRPDDELAVPALQFAAQGKRLLGSYMGDSDPARDIPRYLELWRDGRLPVERMLTDIVPLSELAEAMDALADARVVRRLLSPRAERRSFVEGR